ncbi:MAG: acyl-CoA thioesterase [Gammaproteobacteria bacterium]|nr:acyl-CoA thioesterase [Gammaproteobacteria bacterium]
MDKWDYRCLLEVRDYEIDMQGIVHHSVYINYLEYCRNVYVRTLGVDIHEYHSMGYDLVIMSLEQNYKAPLHPGDKFYVTVRMSREGRLKIIFDQEIRLEKNDSLVLAAKAVSICVNAKTGKPCMPDVLENVFDR